MIVGPPAERPVEFPLRLLDRQVVDRGEAALHQALGVELPVLVAIRAKPIGAVVVPLIGEADRDAIAFERPQLLDQAVVELLRPLAGEERDDLRAPARKLRTVSP